MTALAHKIPDRVPFLDEADFDLQAAMLGTDKFREADWGKLVGMDAIFPKYFYDLCPVFAEHQGEVHGGQQGLGDGYIKTEKDLDKMVFPDPRDSKHYEWMKRWVDENSDAGLAIYIMMRPLLFNAIWAMGFEDFCYACIENPKLVETILVRYIEWNLEVVERLNKIDGIDFYKFHDDIAERSGPMVYIPFFREICMPHYREFAANIKKPWAYHSDGNLMPLMDDLVSLGMNAINPIDPSGMNMAEVKEKYGDKICLWGNIDLRQTLPFGTREDVFAEVKSIIDCAGKGGGLLMASANSLTYFCKPENVLAIKDAIAVYGVYEV
jgi:uroporphyrinogen decarboxylase